MNVKVVPYFRKNKKEAVIYVRGKNEEFQEMMCRLYAIDKDYEVSYVTKNIGDVNLCDVLLVTEPSRISRKATEYYEILKELKNKGIKVELAMDVGDTYPLSNI
jgi:DNA invertase Pin-like site-specific DNA recombinase